jgi:hypothetical protein
LSNPSKPSTLDSKETQGNMDSPQTEGSQASKLQMLAPELCRALECLASCPRATPLPTLSALPSRFGTGFGSPDALPSPSSLPFSRLPSLNLPPPQSTPPSCSASLFELQLTPAMVWARLQRPVGLPYTPPVEMMDPSVPPFSSSTPIHAPGLVQRKHSSASYFTPTIFPMSNSMTAMPVFSVASHGVPVGLRPDVHLLNLQTGVVCQESVKGCENIGQEDEDNGDKDEWTGIDAQELSGVLARLRMGEGTTTGADKDELHLEPHQPNSALSNTTDPSCPSKTARRHVPPPSHW